MTSATLSSQFQSTSCAASTMTSVKYPLHHAAGLGDSNSIVTLLLAADISSSDDDDNSSCSISYAKVGIHQLDSKGRTPLHWAARNGHAKLCRLLIETYKADPNIPSYRDERKGVTPLELSAWRGHYDTVRILHELGANLHRINSWGCGIAHWTALCPTFADAAAAVSISSSSSSDNDNKINNSTDEANLPLLYKEKVTSNLKKIACFLTQNGIKWTIPNGHGQTPMHKAAYGGNVPILQYLISHFHLVDENVDEDGNTAADCAERSGKPNAAKWVRKYASKEWRDSVKLLGLTVEDSFSSSSVQINNYESSREQLEEQLPSPPSLAQVRRAYIELARQYHPDKAVLETSKNEHIEGSSSSSSNSSSEKLLRWFELHSAYALLRDWWTDPDRYDITVRQRTRNRNLVECPLLLTNGENQQNNWESKTLQCSKQEDEIVLFGIRLNRLLQSSNYRQNGLPMDRLARLYGKSYPGETIPNHKAYKCKKLVHFIKKHCESVCSVEYTCSAYLLWPKKED